MRKTPWIALLLLFLAAPPVVSAQGFAIGARAGTLGLGGEVALGLSDVIALRGGFGVFPYEYDGEFDGETYTVTFPTSIWSAGIDIYLGGGPIRLMGGVMGRSGDLEIESEFSGSRTIGDNTYTSSGTLTGVLAQKSTVPFAGIGFGKHTSGGFGFFLDLAAAFTGEPDVNVSVTGPVAALPGIQQDVNREAEKIKDDAGSLLKIWPIVSLGFKINLGAN
jgi:hypothetical protein